MKRKQPTYEWSFKVRSASAYDLAKEQEWPEGFRSRDGHVTTPWGLVRVYATHDPRLGGRTSYAVVVGGRCVCFVEDRYRTVQGLIRTARRVARGDFSP